MSTLRRAGCIVTGDDSDEDDSAVTLHVLSQYRVAEGSSNLHMVFKMSKMQIHVIVKFSN